MLIDQNYKNMSGITLAFFLPGSLFSCENSIFVNLHTLQSRLSELIWTKPNWDNRTNSVKAKIVNKIDHVGLNVFLTNAN